MICEFKGKNEFLSNFAPSDICYGEHVYPTAEHLFQALKTFDLQRRENIRQSLSPGIAKKKGQRVILRPHWETLRNRIMKIVVQAKFDQNLDLRQKLLVTFPATLVEGNYWHDNCWGNCLCDKCGQIEGQNRLGKILMRIRNNYERKKG